MIIGKIVEINYYEGGYELYQIYTNEWVVININKKKHTVSILNKVNKVIINDIDEWRISIADYEC